MTNKERVEMLEKLEKDLFGHILTEEEREAKSKEYLDQRTQEYPWQTVTWEVSEDEIPIRDRKKMAYMDEICRNLVLD